VKSLSAKTKPDSSGQVYTPVFACHTIMRQEKIGKLMYFLFTAKFMTAKQRIEFAIAKI